MRDTRAWQARLLVSQQIAVWLMFESVAKNIEEKEDVGDFRQKVKGSMRMLKQLDFQSMQSGCST